jgi:hypothetical protein
MTLSSSQTRVECAVHTRIGPPRICRLVLAEAVREEIEENLPIRLGGVDADGANRVLDNYIRLIALINPEIVPFPDQAAVTVGRHPIRHAADVPVLLSAIAGRPIGRSLTIPSISRRRDA